MRWGDPLGATGEPGLAPLHVAAGGLWDSFEDSTKTSEVEVY